MTQLKAFTAYRAVPQAGGDPRRVESWALTETARRMKAAQSEPVDEALLLHAVRTNWRLWTIFQSSLLAPDCPVPTEIRQNILSLSNFVDRHTAAILADPNPAKLDVLIDINRQIAGGLAATPAGAAPPNRPLPWRGRHRPGPGRPLASTTRFETCWPCCCEKLRLGPASRRANAQPPGAGSKP